jgi:hypothetical protein
MPSFRLGMRKKTQKTTQASNVKMTARLCALRLVIIIAIFVPKNTQRIINLKIHLHRRTAMGDTYDNNTRVTLRFQIKIFHDARLCFCFEKSQSRSSGSSKARSQLSWPTSRYSVYLTSARNSFKRANMLRELFTSTTSSSAP